MGRSTKVSPKDSSPEERFTLTVSHMMEISDVTQVLKFAVRVSLIEIRVEKSTDYRPLIELYNVRRQRFVFSNKIENSLALEVFFIQGYSRIH